VTSSLPDPVEDPEMSETVAQDRHEEVEGSDAVSDSDADRRQTLSRPPTLSGPYYEPGTVEGGSFENAIGQSLARPLLTAIDSRILSTSPADLDSSYGRRSSTPPCIPLAKRGDGVTNGAQRGAYAYPLGSHNEYFSYVDKCVSFNDMPALSQVQYFKEAAQPSQYHRGRHHGSNKSRGALSSETRHCDAPPETGLGVQQPMSSSAMAVPGRHCVLPQVSYGVTQSSMKEPESKVGGLQKQTVSNCGSLVADPVKTKLKKHQILDEEVDRLEEQFRHMSSVRHGQRMEPRAVSLHDNRRPIEMIPRAVPHMESVERGRASTHAAAIVGNCTSGAHEGSGNVINQTTGFSSVSMFGSNERLASVSEYVHDRQPAGQRFGYTLDRNADCARYDGHEHKRSEHGYRGRSFHSRERAVVNGDGDNSASPSSYDDDDDGRL